MASTLKLRRVGLVAVAAASVFVLSACAPSKGAASDYAGLPVLDDRSGAAPEGENVDGTPQVVWLDQGGRLAVTLWGSSTCPPVASRISVVEPQGQGNVVEVTVPDPLGTGPCTMDFVPHTTEFWTPLHVGPTEPLTVRVADAEITVPVK